MPIAIAEYLGERTDISSPDIVPTVRGGTVIPTCPFSGGPCIKLAHNPPLQPVCSVRIYDKQISGKPFIVCSNRLIPAQAKSLISSHKAALNSIAQTVFPGVSSQHVGFRRQVGINTNPGRLYLDYVLHIGPSAKYSDMPQRVILEVQGGGETSNTGTITRYIDDWLNQDMPTNAFLAEPLTTEYLRKHLGVNTVNVPGIIPNNAWKRQLDQILKKARIATHFGGAFALVCGDVLYDYIRRSVPIGGPIFPGWEIALIGVSEVMSTQPGPLQITHVSKSVFMTFADFLAALQDSEVSETLSDPFKGEFTTLTNQNFRIE